MYIHVSVGEVPGLHSQEELEPLLAPLKEQMREDGNHKTTYDFFVSRVQQNLHAVLCMASTVVIRMYTNFPKCLHYALFPVTSAETIADASTRLVKKSGNK